MRWLDADTGWALFGAVDDLWLGSDGRVMVADYKATARSEHVSGRARFAYANGLKAADGFHDTLRFDTRLVPYDGDRSRVLEAFRSAVSLVVAGQRPDPGSECAWCRFATAWHA